MGDTQWDTQDQISQKGSPRERRGIGGHHLNVRISKCPVVVTLAWMSRDRQTERQRGISEKREQERFLLHLILGELGAFYPTFSGCPVWFLSANRL